MLTNDLAAQSLCLKAQGWTKSRGLKQWRCNECTNSHCMTRPRPDLADLRCGSHHSDRAEDAQTSATSASQPWTISPRLLDGSSWDDWTDVQSPSPAADRWAITNPPPPPPRHTLPPPPPPPPWPPPPSVPPLLMLCENSHCLAGLTKVCHSCRQVSAHALRARRAVPLNETTLLGTALRQLSCQLNSLPAACTPTWTLSQSWMETQIASREPPQAWAHGVCAASAMMLALLLPHVFAREGDAAHRTRPPLRLFGVPPPRLLLQPNLDGDKLRSSVVFRMLDFWRQLMITETVYRNIAQLANDAVQQTWELFRARVDVLSSEHEANEVVRGWRVVTAAISMTDDPEKEDAWT